MTDPVNRTLAHYIFLRMNILQETQLCHQPKTEHKLRRRCVILATQITMYFNLTFLCNVINFYFSINSIFSNLNEIYAFDKVVSFI